MFTPEDAAKMASRRRFRFLFSLAILAVLWWYVLDALDREAARVEQVSYNMMLNQVRSALLVKGAEVMLDRDTEYKDVEGANPFTWMENQVSSYTGVCEQEIPVGKWCFREDLQKNTLKEQRGHLIYRTKQAIDTGSGPGASGQIIAWKVVVDAPSDSLKQTSSFGGGASGLKLKRVRADNQ